MKKMLMVLLTLLYSWLCLAGELQINYNNGLPTTTINFDSIATMQIVKPSVPNSPMIEIQGGTFTMGGGSGLSSPAHQVTVSNFYIAKYEVTQEQWLAVMDTNPSRCNGLAINGVDYGVNLQRPVEMISWYEALVYCNKLSIAEGLEPCYSINESTNPDDWGIPPEVPLPAWDDVVCRWSANGYRMPTEAEWEFAAKGGNSSQGYKFSGSNNINAVAWYNGNSPVNGREVTHTIGIEKLPTIDAGNELGIFDMTGNVWERVWDRYSRWTADPVTNPTGGTTSIYRISRGSSYTMPPLPQSDVIFRNYGRALEKGPSIGLRLARTRLQ